jgi:hypothetical protein
MLLLMTVTEQIAGLDASIEIAAPVADVWRTVSDVRRTGEWSPECRRVVPLGRVRNGTWLIGFNRRGGTRWPTLSRVVRFEPDAEIAWRVMTNKAIWSYTLRATSFGCVLSSARRTPDGIGRFASFFTRRYLGGQAAHDAELQAGMRSGLERIKALVE